MSFKLFDQGHSVEEIKRIKSQRSRFDEEAEKRKLWAESERVLSQLRSIKAFHQALDEAQLEIWQEASGMKEMPKSLW